MEMLAKAVYSGNHFAIYTCIKSIHCIPSVQFSHSVVSNSLWPHGLQHARLPWHHQLPKPTQTHVHWVGDAIQPSHALLSPSPPAFNLLHHQGLFNESVLRIRWPNYRRFSFSISPSKEYSGLISSCAHQDPVMITGLLLSLSATL